MSTTFQGEVGTMYLRGVPRAVRDRFAAACALRNKPMNRVMIAMMKNYAKENLMALHVNQKPRKDKKKGRDRE